MLLKCPLCVTLHTEDAFVDMVFSWNVRKCIKLRSDSVTLCDLCVQLNDRSEWSAWRRLCTTSHCMTESWIAGNADLALFHLCFLSLEWVDLKALHLFIALIIFSHFSKRMWKSIINHLWEYIVNLVDIFIKLWTL